MLPSYSYLGKLSEETIAELTAAVTAEETSLTSQFQAAVKELESSSVEPHHWKTVLVKIGRRAAREIEVGLSVRQHALSSHQVAFDELSLDSNISAESLREMAESQMRRVSAIEEAIQAAMNLEVALDAAETSARKAELRYSIERRQNSLDKLQASRSLGESWRKYFQEVRKGLEEEQVLAVKRYTQQYGPRTSTR